MNFRLLGRIFTQITFEMLRPPSLENESASFFSWHVFLIVTFFVLRKVFLLIMCMMLFATGLVAFMMLYSPVRLFILQNMWLVIVSWALYPILLMILICFEKARRTVPYNYIVLFLITLSLSFMAGCSGARYDKYEVRYKIITICACLSRQRIFFSLLSSKNPAASYQCAKR